MSETNKGWVKIHRQLMSKGFYKKSEFIHLWIHLLLRANHSSNEFLHGNSVIKLKAGQFVTGRKSLSNETGIHESKVQRILKCFEIEQQIKRQSNRQYTIVTILSWDKYQHVEQQDEQQMNNKRTTVERRLNTNKNEKNEKNKKKGFLPSADDIIEYLIDNGYKQTIICDLWSHYACNNWKDNKGKDITNWKQTIKAEWFLPQHKCYGPNLPMVF